MHNLTIREATLDDVDKIYNLIEPYVSSGDLLPRSKDDIAENIRNFIVAEVDGEVVGSIAIKFYGKEVTEFRTLAVKKEFQGKGIGRKLVERGLDIVRNLGVRRVFVLTRNEGFFRKLGFKVVRKEIFPEKVWFDCRECSKFSECDEIAMVADVS